MKQTLRELIENEVAKYDAGGSELDEASSAILTAISEAIGELETKKYFIQRIGGISEYEEYIRLSDIQSLLKG